MRIGWPFYPPARANAQDSEEKAKGFSKLFYSAATVAVARADATFNRNWKLFFQRKKVFCFFSLLLSYSIVQYYYSRTVI